MTRSPLFPTSVLWLALLPWSAQAASFDCTKAASPVEKMICADAALSQLDETLNTAYKQAASQAEDPAELKSRQLQWMKKVRNPCTSPDCITRAYRQRIDTLQQGATTLPLFPATYSGGFSGDETLVLTGEGDILEDGVKTGRHRTDPASPWPDAKYPLLLVQRVDGQTMARHCKIQPDLKKMFCNEGGTLSSEFDRQGPTPKVAQSVAKKCDEEQLYLDVMEAARRALPWLDLKGTTSLTLEPPDQCRITLYYLGENGAVDVRAAYDLNRRPVKLVLIDRPARR